jgi:hypothetical protein
MTRFSQIVTLAPSAFLIDMLLTKVGNGDSGTYPFDFCIMTSVDYTFALFDMTFTILFIFNDLSQTKSFLAEHTINNQVHFLRLGRNIGGKPCKRALEYQP